MARSSLTSSESVVRLALCQHGCGPDKAANVTKAVELIREAAGRGAKLVATQELFASRYFCQVEDEAGFALAESIPGPTSQRLGEVAKKLKIHVTASLFEKRAAGLYHNTSILIDPRGQVVAKYRKMHIPDDPRFYEKYYFAPGDLGWQAPKVAWSKGREVMMGMLVCWDQWYPEAARLTALRGAQVLFYPTAIGWYRGETAADRAQQKDAWQTVQRSHAIANGVFVAAINRVGVEGDLEFWGSSFVADPGGVVIAEAAGAEEEVLVADCDLRRIDQIRQGWPFWRDRRIDAYGGMVERWGEGG